MRQFTSLTSIMANEEMIYYLMNEDDVLKEMSKIIQEIKEILGLSSSAMVRLLLNYFRWDKDTLTDRYWEDPDKLFRILNVANPNSIDYNPLSPPINTEQDPSHDHGLVTCKTCYLEKPSSEFYSLACHHQHCLTCWQLYLESSITHGGSGQKFSCPSRCNQIIDDEEILKLLKNNNRLKERYQQILINTFVETNRLTHWCPGNACSMIVKIKTYLTDCAQMITCDKLQKWEKKNRDESMTSEWIVANTKDCPNCQSSIEKNGGCNHMSPWKDHASRQCNLYEESKSGKNQVAARENLARYMHYFTRYQQHNHSLELESKLLTQIEQRIQEMQIDPITFTEQQAMYKAVDVLQECRRTLKYTYAFAYYLYRNNQAEVFEQNQADLERATEALSGFLEQEIDIERKDLLLKVMDKTRYCDQRRKILLNHCKEGYSEHYWGGLDPY